MYSTGKKISFCIENEEGVLCFTRRKKPEPDIVIIFCSFFNASQHLLFMYAYSVPLIISYYVHSRYCRMYTMHAYMNCDCVVIVVKIWNLRVWKFFHFLACFEKFPTDWQLRIIYVQILWIRFKNFEKKKLRQPNSSSIRISIPELMLAESFFSLFINYAYKHPILCGFMIYLQLS